MSKHTGGLPNYSTNKIDYAAVEAALGFEVTDIYWEVTVTVSGKNTSVTHTDPAEYEEIGDVEVNLVNLTLVDGSEINATQEQIDMLENFRPTDDELYWSVVERDSHDGEWD